MSTLYKVILVVGTLSIAAGIYQAVSGRPFGDYGWDIFLGVTLIGAAFFSKDSTKKEQE